VVLGRVAAPYARGTSVLDWRYRRKTPGQLILSVFFSHQRNGLGVEITPDGIYEGQFTEDLRDGFGVFAKTKGSTYTGEWKKGEWHGHGMVTQATYSGGVKESFATWQFGFNVGPGVDELQVVMRARVSQVQKEAVRVGAAARGMEEKAMDVG